MLMRTSYAFVSAAMLAACAGSAFAADFPVPLNYNWNGMAHAGENGLPDEPNGFRSMADRALSIDGGANSLGTNPIVGTSGITYTINQNAGQLDMVHLGNTGAGTTKIWDAVADGDGAGIVPNWLPALDAHTTPQATNVSGLGLTLDSNSSIGLLYHVSNNGGNFDMLLTFTDNSTVTVTLRAADWFGATNPPAPGPGVASQTRLGATTFQGTSGGDIATVQPWPTQSLMVTEAVVTVQSLIAAGLGNHSGKTLSTITFQNITQPTRGYAIFAATVVTGLGPPANDNCATPTDILSGTTATSNLRATGATTSPCGTGDTSDVWYRYTAITSGTHEVRTCGAAFDTTLAVYTTCAGAALACNNDGCGLASRLQWNATSGATYLIRVAGNNAGTGLFDLVLDTSPAVHTDHQIALANNWNGMVHTGEEGQPDAPAGYRSISDRGLRATGLAGDLNAGQPVGTDFIPYNVVDNPGVLDMVHVGIAGPGSPRTFDAAPDADNMGTQPTWLTTLDHSTPQRTNLAPLNIAMGPSTRVGVLFNISNGGGFFEVALEFNDGSSAAVLVNGPDWFLDQSPGAPFNGIEVQRQLSTFNATTNQDTASLGAPALNVVEVVFSTASLISGGIGDFTGRRITGISFRNPNSLTQSYAVYAATIRDAVPDFSSVAPVGTGSASPNPAEASRPVLLTVAVSPGLNPASTGLAVTSNLSSIGGSATQTFFDNGTNGDVTAGDLMFSYRSTLSAAQGQGAYTLPFTVTDAQARTDTGDITLNVVPFAWNEQTDGGSDAGDLPGTQQQPIGVGQLNAIAGTLGANDADLFEIEICDVASFSATTAGGPNLDSQLFLFRADGVGVSFSDDGPAPYSTISNFFIPGPGRYFIAVTEWDRDPVDSGNQALWLDNPFDLERTPDGPGAANPIAGWEGITDGAAYRITLTGACYASRCGTSDYNGDGDFGTDQDIEAFFACLGGVCCPTCWPGGSDFNGDGDFGTDQDIEAFFRVLAGANC